MCFYLYAPNRNLRIKYESEYILLDKSGASTVIVDCLLDNPSDTSIHELRIIYPNTFCTVQNGLILSEASTHFSDISSTFFDHLDFEKINWVYELPGASALLNPPDSSMPSWATRRIVKQPDPSNATQDISFEGIVGGENNLTIETSLLTYEQLSILNNINYTLMTYKFSQPIEGHPRWIRLKFRGKFAAHNLTSVEHIYLKKFTNTLYYQYQIFSPYDVKKYFINYLLAYKRTCEKEVTCSRIFWNNILDLLHFFERDGLIPNSNYALASSIYEKIFLHVSPGKLERLTDIASEGDIEIAGYLPNRVTPGSNINLYEWKVINTTDDDFSFLILFQTKPFILIYYLLPWLSPIALLIALIRLFK